MIYPKREGIDAGSGEGQATVYPTGWDPMMESIRQLQSATEVLSRIAETLENNSGARDTIVPLTSGLADGTIISAIGHPRLRCKWLVISPIGTGEPVVMVGTEKVFSASIQAVPVPYVIPFPRVIQEGTDIVLYDASAPTTLPDFVAYLIATTE